MIVLKPVRDDPWNIFTVATSATRTVRLWAFSECFESVRQLHAFEEPILPHRTAGCPPVDRRYRGVAETRLVHVSNRISSFRRKRQSITNDLRTNKPDRKRTWQVRVPAKGAPPAKSVVNSVETASLPRVSPPFAAYRLSRSAPRKRYANHNVKHGIDSTYCISRPAIPGGLTKTPTTSEYKRRLTRRLPVLSFETETPNGKINSIR